VIRPLLALALALPLAAAPAMLKVRISTPRGYSVVELPLERYTAAVLAGESSIFQSDEALKAMAVAARTYGLRLRGRHASEGFDLCSTTHCQRIDLNAITPRLEAAASATASELLWYAGKLAYTPYSRDCGGRTEDVAEVWPGQNAPYLKSRNDEYCARAGPTAWRWSADAVAVAAALRRAQLRAPGSLTGISVVRRSPSGRALTLLLEGGDGAVRIGASAFRFAMGRELGWNTVRSDQYDLRSVNGRLLFDGRGSGHGVGLCQRGANEMGAEGRGYREILAYYYPGAELGVAARGLAWQRLGSETVSLFTTQPSQDGPVLAAAERALRAATQRTNWPAPPDIEVRVYPDVESFRNSTGEPGWVAAHTEGRRIHIQPAAVLRSRGALESTLRHELLHVLVESQAAPSLPVWFREGIVGYLEGAPQSADPARPPSEADLRQTQDSTRARRAYEAAVRAVAALAARFGDAAPLAWVGAGLPPEAAAPPAK
jgi:stage II sporulation protein D